MLIFHRYVLRELAGPIVLSILFFTMMLLLRQFFEMAELFIEAQVGWRTIIEIMGILTLSLMVITVPMAALLGVLIGTSRMTGENEILAMRVSGSSLTRIFYPVVVLSFVGAGILMWSGFNFIPNIFSHLVDQRTRIEFEMLTKLEPGRNHDSFSPQGSRFYIYFNEKAPNQASDSPYTLRMKGVAMRVEGEAARITGAQLPAGDMGFIVEPEEEDGEVQVFRRGEQETMFFAERGSIIGDIENQFFTIHLEDGTIVPLNRMVYSSNASWEHVDPLYRENPHRENRISFESMTKTLQPRRKGIEKGNVEPRLYTLAELREATATPPEGDMWRDRNRGRIWDHWSVYLALRNELFQRYALPFALPAFILIGIPLALELRPRAKSVAFLIAVVVITLYYVMITWAGALGARNSPLTIPAYILPNALIGGLGIALFWRVERQ